MAVALLAALAGASVRAPAAHADPVLDHKRARYAHVRAEIKSLDNHAEMLTEQYDRVVWQLGVLRRRMRIETARLVLEQAKLRYEQGVLSHLVIEQYKGGDPRTIEIVLSASSLSQVTGSMDLKQRLDTAVADTVAAIDSAKNAIIAERTAIAAAQVKERADKRQIILRRRQIRRELRRRRRLVSILGRQITVMTAADRIGQAELALEAQKWLEADLKADVADPGQELRDQVALEALQQIGVPYVWGGASPQGFDCSGLVMWLYAHHDVALPHFAASQYHLGPPVAKADLRPGDLVFFNHLDHVAMYIGNGWVVQAPHTGDWVRMTPFSLKWFQTTYVGAMQPGPA
ncbi:MAG TPA: NlpC/P60 family protein [Gaiellales bacterium]